MRISFLRPSPRFSSLILALMLAPLAQSAVAHSFSVLLVSPAGAAQGGAYNGFRLATKERDGHADEESDGHLGGLDVYITPDSGDGPENTDLVVRIGTKADSAASQDIILISLPEIPANATDFLGTGSDGFSARYTAEFGQPPSQNASLGYVAARIIDRAVRAQEGVANGQALREIIAQY